MKKALSLVLALVLYAALFTLSASAANEVNIISEITIEIPNSGGTQFTLTSIYESFADEFGMDFFVGYAPGSELICNKELTLYERTSDTGDSFYNYCTPDYVWPTSGKAIQSYPAGTRFSIATMQEETLANNSVYYTQGDVLIIAQFEGNNSYRKISFVQFEWIIERENEDDFGFTPIADIAVETTTGSASDWATEELQAALAISGLVPDSVAKSGWTNVTSRLAAAEAIVAVIEAATGKTMAQIATEHGWNLSQNGFSDTNNQAVTFLKYAEITTGVSNNRYDPNSNYTRAQIVTMIGRTAEAFFGAKAQGTNPFTDVPDWAAPYVGYAADNEITTGVGGGLFDSNGVLQNQHTAIFCYRALNVWK